MYVKNTIIELDTGVYLIKNNKNVQSDKFMQ